MVFNLIKDKELNGLISKRITDIFGKNHVKIDAQIKSKTQETMKVFCSFTNKIFLI